MAGTLYARGGSGGLRFHVDQDRVAIYYPTTTSPANVFLSGVDNFGSIHKTTSLRRFKLDREPVGVRYALLDLPAVTWRDAGEVANDPATTHRIPGFVAEDLADLSAAHGGVFDPLLTRDDDGALQGVAYDRVPAYLIPVVADIARRVAALEKSSGETA